MHTVINNGAAVQKPSSSAGTFSAAIKVVPFSSYYYYFSSGKTVRQVELFFGNVWSQQGLLLVCFDPSIGYLLC